MHATFKSIRENSAGAPTFSEELCRKLEDEVRKKLPKMYRKASDDELRMLQGRLNIASILYNSNIGINHNETESQKRDRKVEIHKISLKLLNALGVDQHSTIDDLPHVHLGEGGIFEGDELDWNIVIPTIQALAKEAKPSAKVTSRRGSTKNSNLHDLCGRVGAEYARIWGNGGVPLGVDENGEPGPAIRFIRLAVEHITGLKLKPSQVAHAYKSSAPSL